MNKLERERAQEALVLDELEFEIRYQEEKELEEEFDALQRSGDQAS
jgi:hypothetical protein